MESTVTCRVLLLEDNVSILKLLTELLEDRGYEVLGFSNPAICPLQMIPECRCGENQRCTDIIISDLQMPAITGLTFIENQRKKSCKCKHVALISAYWTDEDLAKAQSLNCKTFTKPFFFQKLDEWLDEVEATIDPGRELCNWVQGQGCMSR
jgi:CheY-like chemotaxis protein